MSFAPGSAHSNCAGMITGTSEWFDQTLKMAGRLVRHARRTVVKIFKGHGWAQPVLALAWGPDF